MGEKSFTKQAGEYLSLAFVLPAATLAGWLLGLLLDKVFGTRVLAVPFLILGIIAGFVQLIRDFTRLGRDDS